MPRVLIVDDEPYLLDVLCQMLQGAGYSAVGVDSADRVPPKGAGLDPDVFLIDLMLPDVDGIALACQLRENGYPTTPMVAISASPGLLDRAASSGLFQSTLPKPFDLDAFLECVARETSPIPSRSSEIEQTGS